MGPLYGGLGWSGLSGSVTVIFTDIQTGMAAQPRTSGGGQGLTAKYAAPQQRIAVLRRKAPGIKVTFSGGLQTSFSNKKFTLQLYNPRATGPRARFLKGELVAAEKRIAKSMLEGNGGFSCKITAAVGDTAELMGLLN